MTRFATKRRTCLLPMALVLAAPLTLTACKDEPTPDTTESVATRDDGTLTLAAALGADEDLGKTQEAIEQSQLVGVLDGPASYTLLAPTNEAFAEYGVEADALFDDASRPVLAAIVRNHVLPGHLTPEGIGAAIDRKRGPVSMTTLGNATVTFSRDGGNIRVAVEGGQPASFAQGAAAVNNGVLIPIDRLLLPRRDVAEPSNPD